MPNTQLANTPPDPASIGVMTRQRRRQAARRAEKGPSPTPNAGPNRAERRRKEALLFGEGLLMEVSEPRVLPGGLQARLQGGPRRMLLCSNSLANEIESRGPVTSAVVKCVSTRPLIYAVLRPAARRAL